MKDLLRRLGRIEELSRPADDANVTFYHANLKALPRDYVGEKHTVLVKGWPYQDGTGGECELEERPGPGPALDFGFNGRTILFTYFSYPEDEDATAAGGRLSTGSPSTAEGTEYMRQDLGGAVTEKLAYNLKRADHRPKNRAKQGGKAFR